MDYSLIAKENSVSLDLAKKEHLKLLVAKWKVDFVLFCKHRVKIRNKEGEIVPLILNSAQLKIWGKVCEQLEEDNWVRLFILKGRRQGASTLIEAIGYWCTTLWGGYNVYVQAHIEKSASMLFDMVKVMTSNDPLGTKSTVDNAKSLRLANGSSYVIGTAGGRGGRGGGVNLMHASEAAWYTNGAENLASAIQSVDEVKGTKGIVYKGFLSEDIVGYTRPPSMIFVESTSSGGNGVFYSGFMDGIGRVGRYRSVFVPWTMSPEYCAEDIGNYKVSEDVEYGDGFGLSEREYMEIHGLSLGQMAWRKEKISELLGLDKFRQEFPLTIEEAFAVGETENLLIKPIEVLKARKRGFIKVAGVRVMGVDPASGGGDRFGVVIREGNSIIYWAGKKDLEPMAACEWVKQKAKEFKVDMINIDNGNLGVAIVSYIRGDIELREIVRAVNFGSTSHCKTFDNGRSGPINRRAEMWQKVKEWLVDGSIPDNEEFCSDIGVNRIVYKANNDWSLMPKKALKALGIKSPDLGDALALTFAHNEIGTAKSINFVSVEEETDSYYSEFYEDGYQWV